MTTNGYLTDEEFREQVAAALAIGYPCHGRECKVTGGCNYCQADDVLALFAARQEKAVAEARNLGREQLLRELKSIGIKIPDYYPAWASE